jgi:hypothetical protein
LESGEDYVDDGSLPSSDTLTPSLVKRLKRPMTDFFPHSNSRMSRFYYYYFSIYYECDVNENVLIALLERMWIFFYDES